MPNDEPPIEPTRRPLPEPPPPAAPITPVAAAVGPPVRHTGTQSSTSTHGLGSIAIALFWTAVGARVLAAAAVFHRKVVIDGIITGDFAGKRPRSIDRDARLLIAVAHGVQIGLGIAATVVVAAWCRRVIINARAAGVGGLSPTKATMGWFIPFFWWTMGFRQLRLVLTAWRESLRPLTAWQGTVLVSSVVAIFTRGDGGRIRDLESLSDSLDRLGLLTLANAAVVAFAAYKAGQVMRTFDRAFATP